MGTEGMKFPSNVPMACKNPQNPDDFSANKDLDKDTSHNIIDINDRPQAEDFGINKDLSPHTSAINAGKLRTLHIEDIPLQNNYESIAHVFGKYGNIVEIRMDYKNNKWDAWISYKEYENAFKASLDVNNILIDNSKIKGALCENAPPHMFAYKPNEYSDRSDMNSKINTTIRTPKPPKWILVTGKNENYNYYKVSKYIQKKVGNISSKNISRFNRRSIIIHTNSDTQSHMLCNLKVDDSDMIQEVRPFINFSYGKGVIFYHDLYEFEEDEILEMCPINVWKVKKVPRTSMIILTFDEPDVPSHIFVENVRISVREYKDRPMQCYRCFKYGHSSTSCRNDKICVNCAKPDHGQCNDKSRCINCNEEHKANNRICEEFKKEAAALLKAKADHISIGAAKRILERQMNYAKAVKSNAVTDSGKSKPSVPAVRERSSLKSSTQTVNQDSRPKTGIRNENTIEVSDLLIFQDELPDLSMSHPTFKEINASNKGQQNKKRERQPSNSPPPSPKTQISNRFNLLDLDNIEIENTPQVDTPKEKPISKKAVVEIHHPPQAGKTNETSKPKPNITRNPVKTKSQKKKDLLLKHK